MMNVTKSTITMVHHRFLNRNRNVVRKMTNTIGMITKSVSRMTAKASRPPLEHCVGGPIR
jgi:hypothetical protein